VFDLVKKLSQISENIQFHEKLIALDHWQMVKEYVLVFPFFSTNINERNMYEQDDHN